MKIFLFHAQAGHGHKKAAEALMQEFQDRNIPGLDIRLLDALDYCAFFFRKGYGQGYFFLVKYVPWLWGFFFKLTDEWLPFWFLRLVRGWFNMFVAYPLRKFLLVENPDLIICTHFLAAEVASKLKAQGKITSKVVVVVTDFLVHRFWVNIGTDYFIGMLPETAENLKKLGVPESDIRIFGIPVSKNFLKDVDRSRIKRDHGLEEGRFTLMITSGSFGSGPIAETVDKLAPFQEKIQLIVVCGINKNLYNSLSRKKAAYPLVVLGFVNNMHEWMSVADLMVTRSSGLTTCESLVKGVPMVIQSEIPGQEFWNAELLVRRKAAFRLSPQQDVGDLVSKILHNPEMYKAARENVRSVAKPHAAKEITELCLSLGVRN